MASQEMRALRRLSKKHEAAGSAWHGDLKISEWDKNFHAGIL